MSYWGNKRLPEPTPVRRCAGICRDGSPCLRVPADGDVFCSMHSHEASRPPSRRQVALATAYLARPVLAKLAELVKSPNEKVALGACRTLLEAMIRTEDDERTNPRTDFKSLSTPELLAETRRLVAQVERMGTRVADSGTQSL